MSRLRRNFQAAKSVMRYLSNDLRSDPPWGGVV
jgi:hypothetical protein